MDEPVWLTREITDTIQLEQVREHGGQHGVRDGDLAEASLARPKQRWAYEPDSDLARLAAAYGYGLARNHAYLDGNKRVAFMAMYVFLGLNGLEIETPEPEVVALMLPVADGSTPEEALAEWLRRHTAPFDTGRH